MTIEKSGVYVFTKPEEKKLVVYDKNGNLVGNLKLYNRTWEVKGV